MHANLLQLLETSMDKLRLPVHLCFLILLILVVGQGTGRGFDHRDYS